MPNYRSRIVLNPAFFLQCMQCLALVFFILYALQQAEAAPRRRDDTPVEAEGSLLPFEIGGLSLTGMAVARILSADAQSLLSDHARMAVNILCHHFAKAYRASTSDYMKAKGMLDSTIRTVFSLIDSNTIKVLRNKEMHERGVSAEGGMVATQSALEGENLCDIQKQLQVLRRVFPRAPIKPSMAIAHKARAAAGAGSATPGTSAGSVMTASLAPG